ncbi:UNVERIFIED_CONTAM: hypothetical protein Sradi_1880700 [Sesamum radiatum]|uniref:Uncharacterized protein n=1 Tax=Sesamum radiatum TaxID=300843 RepID=A0AAW2TY82_SESRA
MCMSSHTLMTMVILGPSNQKFLVDVYLDSLIEELQNLWHMGVLVYDHAKNETFMMYAVLMCTVNDQPAYKMASGWSTDGVMGCTVCMDDTRSFHLQNGGRRVTLTGIDNSSSKTIHAIGTRKHSLRIESKGSLHIRD